jgi:DNA-binding PadR family transcriptional regulator
MAKKDLEKRGKVGKPSGLTETEFLIMSMLVSGQKEMYGLELVGESKGRLKKGTVYVLLGRLEEKSYIEGRFEMTESTVPRKLYKPTGIGRKVYDAWTKVAEFGGWRGAFA